jgi:hypothetical protein
VSAKPSNAADLASNPYSSIVMLKPGFKTGLFLLTNRRPKINGEIYELKEINIVVYKL